MTPGKASHAAAAALATLMFAQPLVTVARDGIPTPIEGGGLERSVFVPMRDVVRLATDVYFPAATRRGLSTVVLRTPYRKGNRDNISWAHYFAAQGFAVVVQDVRGRWESEGIYEFYSDDQRDFEDLAGWIAQQPWSNQRVGTFGCSYLGEVQVIQAGGHSPYLKAMLPAAASGGTGSAMGRYRYFSGTMGGAYEHLAAFGWFSANGSIVFSRLDPGLKREDYLAWIDKFDQYPPVPEIKDKRALLMSLPVLGFLDRAGFPPSNLNEFISTPLNDPMWEKRGFLSESSRVDTPALWINGWYDYGVGETLAQYRFFRDRSQTMHGRDHQHLIISPATHCGDPRAADSAAFTVGERPMGDTRFPLREIYTQWFRHWLDADGAGSLDLAPVQYYLMGRNEWRIATDMPVPGTQYTKFFLGAGRHGANGLAGDGTLGRREPGPGARGHSDYVYDPGNPSLIVGGPLCCDFDDRPAGSFDQRSAEERKDTLVFSTPPLEQGIEVTGPLRMVLYVSSDAPDTDFFGKLVDVYPDGRAFFVQEGILRARYREGFDKTVHMEPGKVYRIEVDLQATGNYFGKGHRIRLEVASSHFPRFDRNLNTGGPQVTETAWRIAHNRIHHAPGRASYLLLPIVPEGASKPLSP